MLCMMVMQGIFKGQEIKISWPLKMETNSTETSVRNYHHMQHNIPEDSNLIYFVAEAWNHAL